MTTQQQEAAAPDTEVVEPPSQALVEQEEPQNNLSAFLTDEKAEIEGIEFYDPSSGVTLIVAHAENRRYKDELQMLIRPYLTMIQSNTPRGYQIYRKAEARAMARFVLLGWEGLVGPEGEIPYSEDKAFELLFEPKWRKMRRLVDAFSTDDSAFGPDRVELGKDSEPGSGGSLLTEGT